MERLLQIIIIGILLLIAYQDFKYRAVYWFYFPVLLVSGLSYHFLQGDLLDIAKNGLLNLAFIGVQLLLLTLYFSVKNSGFVNITQNALGLGDILFFVNLCFFFSPLNYLVFYIGSLCFSIGIYLVWKRFNKQLIHIPLAGLQALFFTLIYLIDLRSPSFSLVNDHNCLEVLRTWRI